MSKIDPLRVKLSTAVSKAPIIANAELHAAIIKKIRTNKNSHQVVSLAIEQSPSPPYPINAMKAANP